jgi:hypothetical protein
MSASNQFRQFDTRAEWLLSTPSRRSSGPPARDYHDRPVSTQSGLAAFSGSLEISTSWKRQRDKGKMRILTVYAASSRHTAITEATTSDAVGAERPRGEQPSASAPPLSDDEAAHPADA